jgi:hypothetical protein
MLEIEHMLTATMTALVAGYSTTGMPDLDMQRMDACLHPAARVGWYRIKVGLHRHTALLVHQREHDLRQIEAFGRARQVVMAA